MLLSDPEQQNIRVGIKQLDGDPWQQLADAYPPKSTIEGAITNITDFGIFLRVQGGIEGPINKSGVSDPRQESYEDAVNSSGKNSGKSFKNTSMTTAAVPSRLETC